MAIIKVFFVFHNVENFVAKGEIAGNQHFLLFPWCFQKSFISKISSRYSVLKD